MVRSPGTSCLRSSLSAGHSLRTIYRGLGLQSDAPRRGDTAHVVSEPRRRCNPAPQRPAAALASSFVTPEQQPDLPRRTAGRRFREHRVVAVRLAPVPPRWCNRAVSAVRPAAGAPATSAVELPIQRTRRLRCVTRLRWWVLLAVGLLGTAAGQAAMSAQPAHTRRPLSLARGAERYEGPRVGEDGERTGRSPSSRPTRVSPASTPRRSRSVKPRIAFRSRRSSPAGSTTSGRIRSTCAGSGARRRSPTTRTPGPPGPPCSTSTRSRQPRRRTGSGTARIAIPRAGGGASSRCRTAARMPRRSASSICRRARFVPDGFVLPRGKQDAAWASEDTLLVSREWAPGDLTTSGYPFIVKTVARGKPLSEATEVYRGTAADVGTSPFAITDGEDHRALGIVREHLVLRIGTAPADARRTAQARDAREGGFRRDAAGPSAHPAGGTLDDRPCGVHGRLPRLGGPRSGGGGPGPPRAHRGLHAGAPRDVRAVR